VRSRRRHLLRTVASLAAALALRAAPTLADGPMPVELSGADGRLTATLDLAPAFPPEVIRELGNGLSNVVAVYVVVVPEAGGEPVAIYGRIVEVLYDVWEETFAVTVKDPRSPLGARLVVPSAAGLGSLLSSGRDLDLGPLGSFPAGRLVLEARVEVNPVSREQLQRTREFIASASPRAGGARSVLGAMAGFLLREPAPDAEVRVFRSRPFEVARVPR
jgi:hypothetical protein